ncbi:MAG TPA: TolC family protein [Opitutaceae bacterium]
MCLLAGFAALSACAHIDTQRIDPAQTLGALDRRSLSDPGLSSFLQKNHAQPPGLQWGVDSLALVACYFNSNLQEGWAHLDEIRAGEKTAEEVPNPSLVVTPAYDNQIPGNPTPWSLIPLSIDFPIETAGKRGDRRAKAAYLSQAEAWMLAGQLWQSRSDVRAACVELSFSRQRESLLNLKEAAQANVVRLLEGQVHAGAISGSELTQARIALANARIEAGDERARVSGGVQGLASALGLPRSVVVDLPLAPLAVDGAAVPRDPSALRRRALVGRADVRQALAEFAAAQSALQLEVDNQYPDIHLGPGYQYNSGSAGDNQWQLSLGITLPVFNHNQGPIAEAKAKRAEAAAHFLTVQAKAAAEVDAAIAGFEIARKRIEDAQTLSNGLAEGRKQARARSEAGDADPLAAHLADEEYYTGAIARLDAEEAAIRAAGRLEDALHEGRPPPPNPPSAQQPRS